MAEGHAVARWGDALRKLVGERVDYIRVPPRWRERANNIVGSRLTLVQTHGKHLVLHFSSGWVVHTHAMQYGSWQVGPVGQKLRKEARFARLRFTTSQYEAVFFSRTGHGGAVSRGARDARAFSNPRTRSPARRFLAN